MLFNDRKWNNYGHCNASTLRSEVDFEIHWTLKVGYGITFFGHFFKITWNPYHNPLTATEWVRSTDMKIKQVNHLWNVQGSKNSSQLFSEPPSGIGQ